MPACRLFRFARTSRCASVGSGIRNAAEVYHHLRDGACNCGTPINRGDFLPGHDQRAIHERIAQVGTVKDFITWFDNT